MLLSVCRRRAFDCTCVEERPNKFTMQYAENHCSSLLAFVVFILYNVCYWICSKHFRFEQRSNVILKRRTSRWSFLAWRWFTCIVFTSISTRWKNTHLMYRTIIGAVNTKAWTDTGVISYIVLLHCACVHVYIIGKE